MAVPGGWSRRAVLTGAATLSAAGLAGCSWRDEPATPPPPDPLEPLLAGTRELADHYRAALAAEPALIDQLTPIYQAHLAHAAALRELLGRPGPSEPAGGTASPPAASPSPAPTLADLAEQEQAAQALAAAACLSASPQRAALLGSITAARATHVVVLRA